jgi:uncharacterized membrane protein HdeD (DUF308 family)
MGTAGERGFGSLLFEGFVRVSLGTFVFVWPDQAHLALKTVTTIWTLLTAVAALAVAVASLIGGFAPSDLAWVIGPYSALFGFTLLVLALRLRELAQEIPVPPLCGSGSAVSG